MIYNLRHKLKYSTFKCEKNDNCYMGLGLVFYSLILLNCPESKIQDPYYSILLMINY
jgi:hypothetical protein